MMFEAGLGRLFLARPSTITEAAVLSGVWLLSGSLLFSARLVVRWARGVQVALFPCFILVYMR